MQFLMELWVPILIASGLCLALSVFAYGVLPHHEHEHRRLSTEQELLDALRRNMPAPGLYAFPYRGIRGANTTRADVAANLVRGPVGYVAIGAAGPPRFFGPLAQYFLFFVIVSTLTAYVAAHAGLKDGAHFPAVFRITGTVASMAFVLGAMPQCIWFHRPWRSWALQFIDGLACGLATGAVFGWFWPQ